MTSVPAYQDVAWFPEDLRDTSSWIHVLSEAEVADVGHALSAARRSGCTIETLTKEDFPLEVMGDTLKLTLDRLENGLGLFVLRGLPVDPYTKDELRMIYWGLGLHLGSAVTQSFKGDVLGDVKDFGQSAATASGRGYMSREDLGFHTDTSDIVALFVLRVAKRGGRSLFCSSVAVADEIRRTRPDLFAVLSQPFHWSWKGHEGPGELPYYQQPVFTVQDGRFSSRWIATHILSAQEFPEVPRLTGKQIEAMKLVNSLASDPRFHTSMMFEPGDIQFLNNHVVYHARTEFDDFDEEDRKRHLLRLWLSVPNSRTLNEGMQPVYRDLAGGAVRGGFPSRADEPVYETKVSEF